MGLLPYVDARASCRAPSRRPTAISYRAAAAAWAVLLSCSSYPNARLSRDALQEILAREEISEREGKALLAQTDADTFRQLAEAAFTSQDRQARPRAKKLVDGLTWHWDAESPLAVAQQRMMREVILSMHNHPNPDTRVEIQHLLRYYYADRALDRQTINTFLDHLADDDADVRFAALSNALGFHLGNPLRSCVTYEKETAFEIRSIEHVLTKMFAKDGDARVRAAALEALAWCGPRRHMPLLFEYLSNADRRGELPAQVDLSDSLHYDFLQNLIRPLEDFLIFPDDGVRGGGSQWPASLKSFLLRDNMERIAAPLRPLMRGTRLQRRNAISAILAIAKDGRARRESFRPDFWAKVLEWLQDDDELTTSDCRRINAVWTPDGAEPDPGYDNAYEFQSHLAEEIATFLREPGKPRPDGDK